MVLKENKLFYFFNKFCCFLLSFFSSIQYNVILIYKNTEYNFLKYFNKYMFLHITIDI